MSRQLILEALDNAIKQAAMSEVHQTVLGINKDLFALELNSKTPQSKRIVRKCRDIVISWDAHGRRTNP